MEFDEHLVVCLAGALEHIIVLKVNNDDVDIYEINLDNCLVYAA